jgi:hypothetical protein
MGIVAWPKMNWVETMANTEKRIVRLDLLITTVFERREGNIFNTIKT